ncbi:H+/Cl-antiporter ClcA [Gillisia sp. Hel1_33_143]|uniref:H+/Cl-antiporter ClcA n=3 Tax=Leeuwenhoekiella TaxID=283735 RepID=A0A4Q0PJX2_9FLAO|nr:MULTISPECIES: voltage-gated chloride channel family protein [Flavobacteriaceae]HEA31126.1 chloride channel protein [Leeuwenhoekiella sp.]RXG25722.1 H+/Cl- antiporter ClcA [Leeuwenhoekiella polynyae]RXG27955.1 H+/Cl- antiporter ClcA [Leeuwenhoekiella marinoflava]SDS54482.1 H+/Cl-antiporter ClcA [Gillisia sp. Hel1_33_143]SHF60241.1 H+/Cl-antiporter ClcA [Leeuwenhoekiella marinoflava DSM 3653]
MNLKKIKESLASIEQIPSLLYLLKWILICLLIGAIAGSISAFFLLSLEWATAWRESHLWIIALLPVGGFIIGLSYHLYGNSVVKGNNLLLEEFHSPKKIIPFRMAPLVLFGTVLTHFFGGSAGREGTAVQVGGAVADRFTKLFKLSRRNRKIMLIAGISAGFASVFGTPLAGGIFALEVLVLGRIRLDAIIPSFMAAVFADYFCRIWGVSHTQYHITEVANMNPANLLWALLAGIIFGLVGMLFSKSTHFWSDLFKKYINYPPLRPVIGGVILAIAIYFMGTTKYIGLGIPTIVDSFNIHLNSYDFLLKVLFTSFTLGAGFKGGEVTPLFYIGATLGNVLIWFIPLPMGLLAGMGFVAVFAGATNTPIACTVMGIELFGIESGVFIALACSTAYLFSGHSGVYSSQIIGSPKHPVYTREKGLQLAEIKHRRNKNNNK